jgi:protein-tyrosine phosphatase
VEEDVPDPYYGGEDGFAEVVEIVERNCAALLDEIRAGQSA